MVKGLSNFRANSHTDPMFTATDGISTPVFFMREPGEALSVVEHISPYDWRKRMVCTADTQCYGCEQAAKNPYTSWTQRPRFYIDVLMGAQQVPAVMSQSFTRSGLTLDLLMYYNEHGTIRNTWFAVTKTGTGKKTKYLLTQLKLKKNLPTEGRRLNLHKNITLVDYDTQEQYLTQI